MYLSDDMMFLLTMNFCCFADFFFQHNFNYGLLEIKLCGLGSRIRDVEAFWYKTEIKIIYFVRLYGLPSADPKFLIFKTEKRPHFFLRLKADFFKSTVIMQDICNKFIEINFCFEWFGRDCVGCNIEHLSNIDEVQYTMQAGLMKFPFSSIMIVKISSTVPAVF